MYVYTVIYVNVCTECIKICMYIYTCMYVWSIVYHADKSEK